MKLATYNVNGINGRLDVLLRWLEEAQPDVVCLQELKAPDEKFPRREIERAGYGAIWHGQKSWNGVAILSRDHLLEQHGYESAERRRLQHGQPFVSGWRQPIWFLRFRDPRAAATRMEAGCSKGEPRLEEYLATSRPTGLPPHARRSGIFRMPRTPVGKSDEFEDDLHRALPFLGGLVATDRILQLRPVHRSTAAE